MTLQFNPMINSEDISPESKGMKRMRDMISSRIQDALSQEIFKQKQLEGSYLPEQLENKRKLGELNLQFAPEKNQADLDKIKSLIAFQQARIPLMGQQTKRLSFENENPLLKFKGSLPQEIASAMYLQNKSPELSKLILNSLNQNLKSKQAIGQLNQSKASGYAFQQLPADQKAQTIAQGVGLTGKDPLQVKEFLTVKSLEDLAKENGYGKDRSKWPIPVFPPTKSTLTRAQQRSQAASEINALGKDINESVTPYSRRVFGYSPKQIAESISGTNKEGQAKYLAARALGPEYAGLRIKMLGGQAGIESLREITHKAMLDLQAFEGLVSPEVYKRSQEIMDKWLNRAANISNRVSLRPELSKEYLEENDEEEHKLQGDDYLFKNGRWFEK